MVVQMKIDKSLVSNLDTAVVYLCQGMSVPLTKEKKKRSRGGCVSCKKLKIKVCLIYKPSPT